MLLDEDDHETLDSFYHETIFDRLNFAKLLNDEILIAGYNNRNFNDVPIQPSIVFTSD